MSPRDNMNTIPLYGPDRRLRMWITPGRAQQLERTRLARVVRSIRIPEGSAAREIVAAVAIKGGYPIEEAILYVEDCDEPVNLVTIVTEEVASGKVHHVHRARQIAVTVFYKQLDKGKRFSPSARIQRVLDWAISKEGFNIDPVIGPDMELALHDDKIPNDQKTALPKNAHIGRYVHHPEHCLSLDLIRGTVPNGEER